MKKVKMFLPRSASSYCRTFGSERAEGIEKRGNFAGTCGKGDGPERGRAGREKGATFRFFGFDAFFEDGAEKLGVSFFRTNCPAARTGTRCLSVFSLHAIGREERREERIWLYLRFGRAAVARFGIYITDMDGVKMAGQIAQRLFCLFRVFHARFENLLGKGGEALLILRRVRRRITLPCIFWRPFRPCL